MKDDLFPDVAGDDLPLGVLQYLDAEEIRLCATMPAGKDFGRMLAWVRRHPTVIGYFIAETRAILRETPFALAQVEEVLCRVRRRHGVKITNHKGWFARWLQRLVPEMTTRQPRQSRFDQIMGEWKEGARRG
jgi:hypothetical protein